jgi:CRISPR/Cas system-associated endonuclease Cas1
MRREGTAPIVRPPAVSPGGTLFLYSPNLGLRVRYGSLLVGLGRGRTLTVDRASEPRLRRLVLCGLGGWWTFEVPAWLRGIGASWLQLDLTGRILGSGPSDISPDLPALRRQQALSGGSEVGRVIGVELLTRKIRGQAAALSALSGTEEAQVLVSDHVALLADCSDAEDLRAVESRAAGFFWQAVADVPMQFIRSDQARVPTSWRTVGRRSSVISGAPRGASTPAHAAWNFTYACAAGEVGIALRSAGLDPGISPTGLHADTPSRSSAAYDVLEAIRGDVDRLILTMIQGRRFRRRDFVSQTDGRVRLTAPLARELAEAVVPVARQSVAPIAEHLARTLAVSLGGPRSQMPKLPTNLSGDARSKGRDGVRKGPRKVPDPSRRISRTLLPPACRRCGIVFEDAADRGRQLCDECLPAHKSDALAVASNRAATRLADLRAAGMDPAHGGEAKRKRSESHRARIEEARRFERANAPLPDREVFVRDILPGLQSVPVRRIAEVTGLTPAYCGMVRRGLSVPHPRHWEALRRLAATHG